MPQINWSLDAARARRQDIAVCETKNEERKTKKERACHAASLSSLLAATLWAPGAGDGAVAADV